MPRNIYICIPLVPLDNHKKTRKLLSDLGKPTKRGIKKCPNCGIYNGTRGVMCKNKKCNVVFKEASEKRKINLEAVKLITATSRKVYSVRVRDRGPDYRGFVQLPFLHSSCESINQNTFSHAALCFVDTCQRLFDVSILKCHESEENNRSSNCVHIESALKSCSDAIPLEFKLDILNTLNLSEQIKRKLWLLVNETEDPLVQRVSKSVMAVKCQVSPKHPLGYLHFTFHMNKAKEVYDRYSCSCHEITRNVKEDIIEHQKKCVHYYACICALASDTRFTMEFLSFLNLEINIANLLTGSNQNIHSMQYNREFQNSEGASSSLFTNKFSTNFANSNIGQLGNFPYACTSTNSYLNKQEVSISSISATQGSLNTCMASKVESTTWHFREWLATVTECINQKFLLSACGSHESLIFHIPKKFFWLLKERIPAEYMKVEIINSNNSKNSQILPQEITVYKYIWCLTNILHVKKVFNTAEVQLKTSLVSSDPCSFISVNKTENHSLCIGKYLNVNDSTAFQKESSPFIIEWMPNVSSHIQFGQIKLDFKIDNKYKCTVPN